MKFQIKQKLMALFLVPTLAFIVMIGALFVADNKMTVYSEEANMEFLIFNQSGRLIKGYSEAIRYMAMADAGIIDAREYVKGLKTAVNTITTDRKEIARLKAQRGMGDMPPDYNVSLKGALATSDQLIEMLQRGEQTATVEIQGDNSLEDDLTGLTGEFAAVLIDYQTYVGQMQAHHEDKLWEAASQEDDYYDFIVGLVEVLAVISIALIAILFFIVNKSVRVAIESIVTDVTAIAEQLDLGRSVTNTGTELDDVASNVTALIVKFREVMMSIRQASNDTAQASENLSSLAATGNEVVETTRHHTDQASAAVTEMSASINQIAQNVSESESASNSCADESKAVAELTENTVVIIDQLVKSVDESTITMNQLDHEVEGIAKSLEVITTIAEGTNLLALNAAIEAARAGEHGRGFAVVADEVRKLSENTKESANEIANALQKLKASSSDGVECNNASMAVAMESKEALVKCREAVEHLSANIDTIHDMNAQVATAVEQQACVAKEIHESAEHVAELTNQSADNSEQTAATSVQLSGLATELNQQVEQFKI